MNRKKINYVDTADRNRGEGGIVRLLLRLAFWIVALVVAVGLVISYLTPHISPTVYGSLTIVGIFAPVLYVVAVVLALLSIVLRRWRIFLLLLVVLLAGVGKVDNFYKVPLFREVERPKERHSFTIMSYNLRGFYNDKGQRCVDDYARYFASHMPDVACFQEFSRDAADLSLIDSLFADYYMYETIESGDVVLRTYSRFPIVRHDSISGRGRGTSQWVDIVISESIKRRDTLRIFNNHLYTMNISADDSEDIARGKILQDGDRMMSIIDRIADNTSIRAAHVDTLRSVIDASPYAHIVCGDFNDTPMSYVYRTLSRDMNDAFVEYGRGYGYTFRPLRKILRIDYMLHSSGVIGYTYTTDREVELSDHLPITMRAKLKIRNI